MTLRFGPRTSAVTDGYGRDGLVGRMPSQMPPAGDSKRHSSVSGDKHL